MSKRTRHIQSVFLKRGARAAWLSRLGLIDKAKRREIWARQLRCAFEDLGPAFIKIGQLISIRPDMFAPEYVFEMESLRDSVAALPARNIKDVIERDFGRGVEELFDEFEEYPIGSASIAQVHRARLRQDYRTVQGTVLAAGTPLAIKVVRPGTQEIIAQDLRSFRSLVLKISGLKALRRFNLTAIVDELADSLSAECDLRNEARTSDRFAFHFRDWPRITTAEMVWPLISRNVITMRYVEGYHLNQAAQAEAAGVDARYLALHGAEVFMRQVLEMGRFHADLHQSNIILTPDNKICYIDFGIMGEVALESRDAITQILIATVYGDAKRAIRYSAEVGLVIPEDRQELVEAKVANLMSVTLGAQPRDIRGFAMGFLRIMNDEQVSVPRGFGLLIKGLVIVEGCAQMVYPDIDVTEAAKPYATKLIALRMTNPARIYQRLPAAFDAFLNVLVE